MIMITVFFYSTKLPKANSDSGPSIFCQLSNVCLKVQYCRMFFYLLRSWTMIFDCFFQHCHSDYYYLIATRLHCFYSDFRQNAIFCFQSTKNCFAIISCYLSCCFASAGLLPKTIHLQKMCQLSVYLMEIISSVYTQGLNESPGFLRISYASERWARDYSIDQYYSLQLISYLQLSSNGVVVRWSLIDMSLGWHIIMFTFCSSTACC